MRTARDDVSLIHFYIPRVAAHAVSFPAIRAAARMARVARPSIECSHYRAVRGKTRIMCAPDVAVLLVSELSVIASAAKEQHNTALLIACESGMAAATKAIDQERQRPSNESPAAFAV